MCTTAAIAPIGSVAYAITPDPTNTIAIDTTNTAGGGPAADDTTAQPGDVYTYNFVVSCASVATDCVDLTFTDTFPTSVVVDESTIPADIPELRDVTWDGSTLTVEYTQVLSNPAAEAGKIAGTADSFSVSVELPAETPLEDGDVIANQATVASFFIDSGTGERTPIEATDPSNVNVLVPTPGILEVVKQIGDNPAGLALDDATFTFTYECTLINGTVLPQGTVTATPTTPGLVTGIPSGSTCEVWESGTNGGIPDHDAANPSVVLIEPSLDPGTPILSSATVTNDFPLGEVSVLKQLTGFDDPTFVGGPYPATVDCTFLGQSIPGFPLDIELSPGVEETFEAPVGSVCNVIETDNLGATSVTYEPANAAGTAGEVTVPSEPGATLGVTITNDFPFGAIAVLKTVTSGVDPAFGLPDFADETFVVAVTRLFGGETVPGFPVVVEVLPDEESDALVAPVGSACTVTETDDHGALTVTYDPANPAGTAGEVTVTADSANAPIIVTITNDFNTAGSLVIRKTVSGPGAPAFSQGPFVFDVTCGYGDVDDVYDVEVVVPGSTDGSPVLSQPVTGLPIGAECTVTEVDSGGADIVSPPQTMTIEENGQANVALVVVNNPFSAGTVSVVKHVDGTAASSSYVAGLQYTVVVQCAVNRDGQLVTVLDRSITVGGDGIPVQVTDDAGDPLLVPLGSRCWGSETNSFGARTTMIDHTSYATGAEVVADAAGGTQPLQINVTNTFDAASLTVTKRAINEPAPGSVYTVAIACTLTTPGAPIAVPLLSGTSPATLTAGQSVTVGVLFGSTCQATELAAGGATVTYAETGGTPGASSVDGVITLTSNGSIVVTNTYPARGVLPASGSETALVTRSAAVFVAVGFALVLLSVGTRRRRTTRS